MRVHRGSGRRAGQVTCRAALKPCRNHGRDRDTVPEGAAELVTAIARVIPTPGGALTQDDAAWSAFEQILGEAAEVLVSTLGHAGRPALPRLLASSLADDPVRRLVLERALDRAAAERRD